MSLADLKEQVEENTVFDVFRSLRTKKHSSHTHCGAFGETWLTPHVFGLTLRQGNGSCNRDLAVNNLLVILTYPLVN